MPETATTSATGPHPARLVGFSLLALGLSVLFFSPRLWLLREYVPNSAQWTRAASFLKQCADPLRRDIEPAMLWRLLPPVAAHVLHLPGKVPLVLPWLGVIVATVYVAVLLRRRCSDDRFVFGGTLLFAGTSAVLVPVGWLGINDAWVWLGLLAVAFGRSPWTVPVACLLCPWIDERFIIGLPLACWLARNEQENPNWPKSLVPLLWLLPYALTRLILVSRDPATAETLRLFTVEQLTQNFGQLPRAPLGWWMGLRAGWVVIAGLLWLLPPFPRLALAAGLAGTLTISALLASDLSRSAAIVTPALVAGCLLLAKLRPAAAPRWLLILGTCNLLIPAAHVTLRFIDPISPLPIELFRVLR